MTAVTASPGRETELSHGDNVKKCYRPGAILAVLAVLCGCDESSSSPTESTDDETGTTVVTESYTGSFGMGGTSDHEVGIGASGTTEAVLVSLAPLATLTVGMGIGTLDDSRACTLATQDTSVRVGDTLTLAVTSGLYCVRLFDVGNVPEGAVVDYTVDLHLPSTPVEIESVAGSFGLGETSCHDVDLASSGSLELTLLDLEPLASLRVGMGVGRPAEAGSCALFAEDREVSIGNILLSEDLDAGDYCVCVFDVGNVFPGQTVTYELRIEHP